MSPERPTAEKVRGRSVHDRALGLLAVRPRSRRELRDRLVRAGFDESDVAAELDRLASVGLVDDLAFARSLVEHHVASRSSGTRGIRADLSSRGIDPELADLALAGHDGGDRSRAERLATERVRRMGLVAPEKAFSRLVSLLLRRGHAPDVARDAARKALQVRAGED